jgi:hypothetical protein
VVVLKYLLEGIFRWRASRVGMERNFGSGQTTPADEGPLTIQATAD